MYLILLVAWSAVLPPPLAALVAFQNYLAYLLAASIH